MDLGRASHTRDRDGYGDQGRQSFAGRDSYNDRGRDSYTDRGRDYSGRDRDTYGQDRDSYGRNDSFRGPQTGAYKEHHGGLGMGTFGPSRQQSFDARDQGYGARDQGYGRDHSRDTYGRNDSSRGATGAYREHDGGLGMGNFGPSSRESFDNRDQGYGRSGYGRDDYGHGDRNRDTYGQSSGEPAASIFWHCIEVCLVFATA